MTNNFGNFKGHHVLNFNLMMSNGWMSTKFDRLTVPEPWVSKGNYTFQYKETECVSYVGQVAQPTRFYHVVHYIICGMIVKLFYGVHRLE